jgi:hypothetical protein
LLLVVGLVVTRQLMPRDTPICLSSEDLDGDPVSTGLLLDHSGQSHSGQSHSGQSDWMVANWLQANGGQSQVKSAIAEDRVLTYRGAHYNQDWQRVDPSSPRIARPNHPSAPSKDSQPDSADLTLKHRGASVPTKSQESCLEIPSNPVLRYRGARITQP